MIIKKDGLTGVVFFVVLVAVLLLTVIQNSNFDGMPHININPPVKSDSQAISDFLV